MIIYHVPGIVYRLNKYGIITNEDQDLFLELLDCHHLQIKAEVWKQSPFLIKANIVSGEEFKKRESSLVEILEGLKENDSWSYTTIVQAIHEICNLIGLDPSIVDRYPDGFQ
jgi:hypothetical protein